MNKNLFLVATIASFGCSFQNVQSNDTLKAVAIAAPLITLGICISSACSGLGQWALHEKTDETNTVSKNIFISAKRSIPFAGAGFGLMFSGLTVQDIKQLCVDGDINADKINLTIGIIALGMVFGFGPKLLNYFPSRWLDQEENN